MANTREEVNAQQRAKYYKDKENRPEYLLEKHRRAAELRKLRGYKQQKNYEYQPTSLERRCWDVERRYGLKPEEYLSMIQKQNNKCLICNKEETWKSRGGIVRPLAVDHCHKTGKVRGLLCTRCNALLGHADDSIDTLMAAISYLKEH